MVNINTLTNRLWDIYNHKLNVRDDWHSYYTNITSRKTIKQWISYTNTKFPPTMYQKKMVIDMGCGWGLFSILACLQGAERIYAIGPDDRLDFLARIIKTYELQNRVSAIKMYFDVKTESVYRENVDVIIGNEFLEHLTDLQRVAFWAASWKTLNNGGRVLMHTHNTDNPRQMRNVKAIWIQKEDEYLREKRKNIILRNFPDCLDVVDHLVEASYGKNEKEIIELCIEFLQTGRICKANYSLCAVNTDYGIPEENLISPQKVKKEMERAGFYAKIQPWLGSWSICKVFYPFGNYVPFSLLKRIARSVTFVGVKK
jgi:2-polyprenyl-3-methyl-5-hydroxy-6-metoxy-1,4-benzoquinol methylase